MSAARADETSGTIHAPPGPPNAAGTAPDHFRHRPAPAGPAPARTRRRT